MDGLSDKLNECKVGCVSGSIKVNNLVYADDLALLSPSVKGLDRLLDICEGYGKDNDIKYNPKKSTTMIIRSEWYKNVHFPAFKLNGEDLKEVTQTKYMHLGHILTHDLTDDKDVLRKCRQV